MKVLVEKGETTLIHLLKKICHPEAIKLPVGDLLIANDSGALVMERKTVRDLIGSIRSNRLWSQLLGMMKADEILGYEVKRRLLVIQGGFWEYTNISSVNEERLWSTMMGALLSINYVYDTPCIVCENNFAFETFLRILLQREAKGKNDSFPEGRWHKKPIGRLPVKDVKQYVLDAIPTIGEARAKKLLESYSTISDIAKSSKSELMKVPGIGEKRAEKIYEIFH
ncbi:MAG TPA: helix-hairpin-helix domain-containing protein [Nitrososphaerales archaeon]|nr:helix-hairpin-helix domain-containing protein [Nitrososphaerales archaeon]